MRAHDMTEYHRADLRDRTEAARAEVRARTEAARAFGKTAPQGEPDTADMKLYHAGGHWAMIFCLWFSFVTPIVLILLYWD